RWRQLGRAPRARAEPSSPRRRRPFTGRERGARRRASRTRGDAGLAPRRRWLPRGMALAPRSGMDHAVALLAALLVGAADLDEAGAPAPVAWRREAELPRAEGATALAIDPLSGRVAVGDATGVLVVQAGGRLERVLRRGPVHDLAFLPGGGLLAATAQ